MGRYFKKLVGEKIYLSPVNPEDAEIYADWVNDLEVTVPLGTASKSYSLNREREFLEKLSRDDHSFAIVKIATDELVGNCGLFSINHIHKTAELGLFIGDKANRGQGYAKESIHLLLDYGFSILNLNNIMLKVFEFNKDAVELYKSIGFREFGRRTQAYLINKKFHDELFMEILAKDFTGNYIRNLVV